MPRKPTVDMTETLDRYAKKEAELKAKNQLLADAIGLDEFEIEDIRTDEQNMTIYAVPLNPRPKVCKNPACGGTKFHVHSHVIRTFRHFNIDGRFVGIVVKNSRFACTTCKQTTVPTYNCIDPHFSITRRFYDTIVSSLLTHKVTDIANLYGIPFSTVQGIMSREFKALDDKYIAVAPRVLGLDEVHFNRKYYGTFVDIESSRFIDISQTRSKADVKAAIRRMVDYKNIEVVVIDFWRPYKDVIEDILPKTTIVIDKYHVTGLVRDAMDKCRKRIGAEIKSRISTLPWRAKVAANKKYKDNFFRNKDLLLRAKETLAPHEVFELDSLFAEFPDLKVAYELKEKFRLIFDKKRSISRADAEKEFADWVASIPASPEFDPFRDPAKTVTDWHKYVFNYFDEPYTNGVTEAMNGELKYHVRQAKGLSFANLRVKMLYAPDRKPKMYEPVGTPSVIFKAAFMGDVGVAMSGTVLKTTKTDIPHVFQGSPIWANVLGPSLNDGYVHLRCTLFSDAIYMLKVGTIYEL